MTYLHPSVTAAGRWYLYSGIQSQEGGVARYYRSDIDRNNPVSTEITGYAVSAYSWLFQKTGEPQYRERMMKTARFLTRDVWEAELEAFPFEFPGCHLAYFFDAGIIIRGLLAAWRVSGEQEFLEVAASGGRAMWRDFYSGEDFHPVLELPSKRPAARDGRWSRSSGCYQLKAALSWHELAGATGDADFRSYYERLLSMALAEHTGFLPGGADENLVMDRLHAYCYCLEAFLADGIDIGEGVARVACYLQRIGPRFARSDVYAQLLRLRILSGSGLEQAPAEVRELEKFQAAGPDARVHGGFYFGMRDGAYMPYVNPVSTAFAMQALQMWHEYEAGALQADYRTLI